jgi:long-chain acyl-CoA synthetase
MGLAMFKRFEDEIKTIPRMFYNTVEHFGERPALKYKVDDTYMTLDYKGFADIVEKMGSGLLSLGLNKGDRLCLMAPTSAPWAWADFAIQTVGGVTVTVYPSLSVQETAFIVNHSDARYLVAGNAHIAEKVASGWKLMPGLEKIIVLESGYQCDEDKLISIDKLKEMGKNLLAKDPGIHRRQWEAITPSDPSSIIYTSGTTGQLKGSLLSQEDLLGALGRSLKHMIIGGYSASCNDVAFSLLPLAHIWERNNSYLGMIAVGGCIGYAEKPSTLLQDIQAIKPTWVLLVPRLWDRIYSGFRAAFTSNPDGKKLYEWAINVGEKALAHRTGPNGAIDLTADPTIGMDDKLKADFLKADEMVFGQLRQLLGGRIKIPYSGGGALPPDLHRNYLAMNFPLLNGWGLTETAAGISHGTPNATKIGWLSKMVPGVEAKLEADGEILVRGIGIIREYYKNETETADAFTVDGWFKTGDLGEFDAEGFLRIIDRKKYIIVMDTGKNVAPAKIESQFVNSPFIEQVLVLGNDRKFISAMVVPGFDLILYMMKDKGYAIDESLLVYAEINGINSCIQVGDDVVNNPMVKGLIDGEIVRINEYLEEFETIKKYTILPRKFTEENGELTPTLKLKNKVIFEHFRNAIEAMYA